MQTGNHRKLKVWGSRRFNSEEEAYAAEQVMHWHFKQKKIQGEWFDVTVDEFKSELTQQLGPRLNPLCPIRKLRELARYTAKRKNFSSSRAERKLQNKQIWNSLNSRSRTFLADIIFQ